MPAWISVWYLVSWLTTKIANNFGGVLTPEPPPPSYGLASTSEAFVNVECIMTAVMFNIFLLHDQVVQ